ncbi:efflux RND transporter periplasmic adaptor subunit [Cohnella thermotolerans]|uniref:efflux RND transporter periplasmic adaptor subunit n=1 Tax=Cohnella thermotolerans TaxID=329858 RepID=UPI00041D7473|nr:efflux RND transporter periplasmic adaptor subunit [Cohnella thermotolerans]
MKKRLKKWIVWIVVICLVGGGGGFGYWWFTKDDKVAAAASFTQTRVTKGTITESVSGTGTVEASETETVKVSENSTVAEVKVEKNSEVKKGQVLATFEGEDVSLNLSKAKLNLEQQQMQLEQAQEKWKSLQISGASDSELEDAQMSIKTAQLNIKQTQLEIEDYEEKAKAPDPIVAPIDGTVTAVNIKAGDDVSPQLEAFTIVNYNKLDMTISADELDITKLKVGQSANITLDALSDRKITGKVTEISKDGTSSNGVSTFPVTVTLDQTDNVLPGMNGDVEIVIQSKENALMVPIEAVQQMGTRYFVRVPNDGSSSGAATGGSSGQAAEAAQGTETDKSASGAGGNQAAEGGQQGAGARQGASTQQGAAHASGATTGQAPQGGQMPQGGFQGGGQGGYQRGGSGGYSQSGYAGARRQRTNQTANADFKLQEITVGITTDSMVEVVSGLSEGQTVLIPVAAASTSNTRQQFGMGGFGMGGGAFIGGGMGGGFQGGGGNFRESNRSSGATTTSNGGGRG